MSATKKVIKYKRRTGALPPLVFTVDTECGTVEITAKHLTYHENAAMDLELVGAVPDSWDTKAKLLRERVLKLARVTLSVDTGDPEDPDIAACGGNWEQFYALPGNENLAYLGWYEYGRAVDGHLSKSGSQVRGDRDDESGAEAQPGGPAAVTLVPAVRGAATGGGESEAPVPVARDRGVA